MEDSPEGPAEGVRLQINVTYDSSVNSAPAGFKTAVQAAVQFFDTTFTNNITVNIAFGWGEIDGQTLDAGAIGESLANYDTGYNYSQVRGALATADAGSSVLLQAVTDLPTVDPTRGVGFGINTAEEKALGLISGSDPAIDGYVGLDSTSAFTFDPNNRAVAGEYDAIGVLEHEISEVLGRSVSTSASPPYAPLDLFRFTSAGVHTLQPGSAYFSVDNGVTDLKAFNGNRTGDYGDWASGGQVDAFNAFDQTGVEAPVSSVDVTEMALLGYTVSSNNQIVTSSPTTVTGSAANNYTVTFEGVYLQYTVGAEGATVTGGPENANDTLVGIHRIQFVDGYLAYSPTDTAGQVYRLYEATLDRAPDQEGLTNWVNQLNAGASLQSVANGFVASTEFQDDYGPNLSNTQFVTLLYENVLHRAPDTSGLDNWVSMLASGQDTRAQVVLGFSESTEDINDLAAPVEQGLWVGNPDAAEVARLYDTALGRLPDASGLASWTQALENGTDTLVQVAQGFVNSAEFQSVYGSLNDTQFVELLYENTLHRAADTAGLNNWVSDLAGGMTRAQVVVGFSESPEHIALTAPHIDSGIWVTG